MAKIAVIGDRDSVLGFRALGLEVHTVEDSTEARHLLRKAAEEGCAAVFLTEALAATLQEEIDRYKEALTPAIVLIPGKGGSLGLGETACTTPWSVPWAQTSLEGSVTMGKVIKVSGPLVVADGMADANMADVVRVGPKQLIGEILNMTGDRASIQVYEETSGLGPGAEVVTTGAPLSVELGPGLIESIYDGIQRPLEEIRSMAGAHIPRGIQAPPLPEDKKWSFTPVAKPGDAVVAGDVLGTVPGDDLGAPQDHGPPPHGRHRGVGGRGRRIHHPGRHRQGASGGRLPEGADHGAEVARPCGAALSAEIPALCAASDRPAGH